MCLGARSLHDTEPLRPADGRAPEAALRSPTRGTEGRSTRSVCASRRLTASLRQRRQFLRAAEQSEREFSAHVANPYPVSTAAGRTLFTTMALTEEQVELYVANNWLKLEHAVPQSLCDEWVGKACRHNGIVLNGQTQTSTRCDAAARFQ